MYTPNHFNIREHNEIYAFVQANAFGQLISLVNGRLFSSHIPFLLSEDKTKLLAHIAKQNPQHLDITGQEVLISLEGPHDYISPSWYINPGVPTWNYQAVHIYGTCSTFTDPERMKTIVDSLSEKYESGFEKPWIPEYKASMLHGIIGLEIAISDIQCKFKLSQNRPSEDIKQVIEKLNETGSEKLAKAMIKHNNAS